MQLPEPIIILLERYLSELTLEPSTIELYRKNNMRFILWLTKSKHPVKEPTRAAFCIYWQQLRNQGLSVRTIDNYLACVRGFFKWLMEERYYDKNITAGTKSLRKSDDYIRAPLSDNQAMNLLQSLKGNKLIEKRNYAIVNLMTFLGLRRIEVTRLDVKDIYPVDFQWFIKVHGKGHSEKDSELPITERILFPIQEYWQLREFPLDKDSPAFVNHAHCSTGRITPHFISGMVKTALRSIGLDDKLYTSHSLRHCAAYYAVKSGCKIVDDQQMLRQKDGRVTEQYLKAFNEQRIINGAGVFGLDEYFKNYEKIWQESNKKI
jgi:site-specific recombinase XerD